MKPAGHEMAYHQGIADWLRYKNRVPLYYRGTELEASWLEGHKYAQRYNH